MSIINSCNSTAIERGGVADKAPPDYAKCHQEEEGSQNRTKLNRNVSISRRLKKGRVAELSSRFDCPPDRVVVRVRRNRIEEVKLCRAPSAARSFRNGSKMNNDSAKITGDAKRKPSFRRTPGKVREAVRKLENFRVQEVAVSEKVEPKQVSYKQEPKPLKKEMVEIKEKASKYGKLYEKLRLKPTAKTMKKPMTLPKPDLKSLENGTVKNGKAPFLNEPSVQRILRSRNANFTKMSKMVISDNESLLSSKKDDKNELVIQKDSFEDQDIKQLPHVPSRPIEDNDINNLNEDNHEVANANEDSLYINLSNKETNENDVKQELSEEERLYQEIKLRIKPNQSFLFRSISKTESSDIYMNLMEIEEENCVNESVNNSDSVNNRYSNSCDIYLNPKPFDYKTNSQNNSNMSVNNSNPSINNSKNSIESLNKFEGVVLRRDLASRNADNEYDVCQDITIVNNIKNGTVYSEKHLYQRLSDCSSKLYDHLCYEEHNYEMCNEPLPPRNGLSSTIRHSNSSQSSDERVCSLYETIPAATMDCGDGETENLYDVVRGGRDEEECYESIRGESPIPVIKKSFSKEALPLRNSNSTTAGRNSSADRISPSLSSDRQSNSIYGAHELNDLDSDGWEDISETEQYRPVKRAGPAVVIIRERARCHRSPSWSRKVRRQRSRKGTRKKHEENNKFSHHYESLPSNSSPSPVQVETSHSIPLDYESDSFDSDSDSDGSSNIRIHNDSGVDMDNCRLPEPPPNSTQSYSLSRFANAASRKMKKLRRNWSLTKNDISKSLSRIKKPNHKHNRSTEPVVNENNNESRHTIEINRQEINRTPTPHASNDFIHLYNSATHSGSDQYANSADKSNSLSRSKYWSFKTKFRRSTSAIADSGFNGTSEYGLQSSKSTFYLTDSVDVDSGFSTGSERFVNSESKASPPELPPHTKRRSRPMSSPDNDNSSTSGRRSVLGIRPLSPPPPPPNINSKDNKSTCSKRTDRSGRGTSWYAECGLFKPETQKGDICRDRERSSSTSWYAEVGLYQTSAASTASSSGMSTAPDSGSDSGHYMNVTKKCTLTNDSKIDEHDIMQHRFEDEPLYQFYNASKLQSVCSSLSSDSEDTDGYEEVGPLQDLDYSTELTSNRSSFKSQESSKDITPVSIPKTHDFLKLTGTTRVPSRTLWCEIPEVVASNILGTLTAHQRRLQEAKFELVSSEASYLNSLNLLRNHFMGNAAFHDKHILTAEEWLILFGNVDPVYNCSSKLLSELELCWQQNILLPDVCEKVKQHAEKEFHVYIKYCEQQPHLDRTLKKLKDQRGRFYEHLSILEQSPACQGLGLHSFLMLPMQRITRFPLLIDAVLKRLDQTDDEYPICQSALSILNHIVHQCNEAARQTEHMAELYRLSKLLEYPQYITPVQLVPRKIPRRVLVRSGELTQISCRGDDGGAVSSNKLTFGKKLIKTALNFFLFTDIMIIAKKKSDENYMVVGHCPRSLITVISSGPEGTHIWPGKEAPAKHMLLLTILENHEGKTVEMFLSCASESDRQRWLEAWSPPSSDNPDEVLYEDWDCPQLIARHQYLPRQPDELGLEPGDVINVNRKMADGWYHGERIRDGAKGWFPGNYTEEIGSPHLRARYLKQRYRLMAYNANFEQRRKR